MTEAFSKPVRRTHTLEAIGANLCSYVLQRGLAADPLPGEPPLDLSDKWRLASQAWLAPLPSGTEVRSPLSPA